MHFSPVEPGTSLLCEPMACAAPLSHPLLLTMTLEKRGKTLMRVAISFSVLFH